MLYFWINFLPIKVRGSCRIAISLQVPLYVTIFMY